MALLWLEGISHLLDLFGFILFWAVAKSPCNALYLAYQFPHL